MMSCEALESKFCWAALAEACESRRFCCMALLLLVKTGAGRLEAGSEPRSATGWWEMSHADRHASRSLMPTEQAAVGE